jgi:Nif-specific regulatory protein
VEVKPRLVAISGPLQGKEFALTEDTSIGRDPTNTLFINEQWISREHCVIKTKVDRFKIVDLDSHNGTFVNDVPVKERALEHGDRIQIASSQFIFLTREDDAQETPSPIRFDDKALPARSTVQLRREDALYLKPDRLTEARLPAPTIERDLSALLRVTNAIKSARHLEGLQQTLLEQIFDIVPADRGAILLGGEQMGSFVSEMTRLRAAAPETGDEPMQVSRTLVEQVQKDKVAILCNDPFVEGKLSKTESLIRAQVQSVLCLPLLVGDRLIGVLYLDSQNPDARFEKNDLELLTAIASIAAPALENAQYLGGLEAENRRLQEDAGLEHSMVGDSAPMREVYQFMAKVSPTDSTVLVYGESGTGKELAARAIHGNSLRVHKPFVKIDCTTLTENLLESELFGHEKGAFTGAIAQKKGKLELADGGTVFLDELGELPLPLQSKLLRVLQDREFERVGGTRVIPVDVRMIAATNRDLTEEMKKGKFREDLFYRLNVISVTLPPLRERRDDIPLLANYFATKYSKRTKRLVRGISDKAADHLRNYDWPGNVRELENTIERAIVLGSTDSILPEDLTEDIIESKATAPETAAEATTYHDALGEKKKELVYDAVKKAKGNYTEAAKALGLHPNYLHRLIRNLNMKDKLKQL